MPISSCDPTSAASPAGLEDAVGRFLDQEQIRGGRVLAAVSGGPDSTALLLCLHAQAAERGLQVVAAHCNHQLRGADSDGDQLFVEELCRARSIPLEVRQVDTRRLAREAGANLEGEARRLRYACLADAVRGTGASWLATGHTANDQAETVLFHLLRGTGLRGLRGIAARRTLAATNACLVRPLLAVSRRAVEGYLERQGIVPRLDRSNLDLARSRNRIRHELLPRLEREHNPEIVAVLCRLAAQAGLAQSEMTVRGLSLLSQAERPRAGGTIVLDAAALGLAPRHLTREALHLLWEREGWPLADMAFADWDRLADLAGRRQGAFDLPGGVHARRKAEVLQLSRRNHRGRAGPSS